eukprot:GGOE01014079.1.p1 GENE.GGOE01014079.1~~GGOE01014079.1.p1  ORF type:complete len:646 (-),score=154.62 GGOE01014079.1:182-2068(-)
MPDPSRGGHHAADYGACSSPHTVEGRPWDRPHKSGQPWLCRHVESLTLFTGMVLLIGVLTFHHTDRRAQRAPDQHPPLLRRAKVVVQPGNASAAPPPQQLSSACTYRGLLSPPRVQGGSCQCLEVPDGPAFVGDHCEAVRCSGMPMVECARRRIYPAFSAVRDEFGRRCRHAPNRRCRKLIMSLRDTLNIFGFAYFPVKGLSLPWLSVSRCVPYNKLKAPRHRETHDPVLVLMQYTQDLYQAIGDTADAEGSQEKGAVEKCQEVQDTLIQRLLDLIHSRHIGDSDLSWEQYLDHPGHQDWSIRWRASLYLASRGGKGQFWGRLTPDPYLSCDQNGCALVTNQVEKTVRWLQDLEGISRHRPWWEVIDRQAGKEFPNFVRFHKVRKALRAILNTHLNMPTVSPALFLPVSLPATEWVRHHSSHPLPDNATWADAFCVGDLERCHVAVDLIALLMMHDAAQFPLDTFWRVAAPDFHYLRALATIGLGNVGTNKDSGLGSSLRPQSTGCPDVADRTAFKDSQSGVTATAVSWDGQFRGTLCGLVPWMGAVHDKMVAAQNAPQSRALVRYVLAEAAVLGHRLRAMDVERLLVNVSLGTCYAPLAQEPSSISFPIVILSVAIVAVIATYLLWR